MPTEFILDLAGLDTLIESLSTRGYEVYGPTVVDGAIVLDRIHSTGDLPAGRGDEQGGGTYRLTERVDGALFGYAVGPSSLKRLLFPPRRPVWTAELDGGIRFRPADPDTTHRAVIGARACDLAAMSVQDRVFVEGPYRDPDYASRREHLFTVAVDCTHPAATCFCASMGTGPAASGGFDLALVEIVDDDGHRFLGRTGSEAGEDLLASLPHSPASGRDREAAGSAVAAAASAQVRSLSPELAAATLRGGPDHRRWLEVGHRCLACGNCTQVCPTCFCVTVVDSSSLDGSGAERWRRWDSCFALDFSFMGGRSVRHSVGARYRQWLTHKLSTWREQFGVSGCVGCGRCITWCPVGIDLTEEVAAMSSGGARA